MCLSAQRTRLHVCNQLINRCSCSVTIQVEFEVCVRRGKNMRLLDDTWAAHSHGKSSRKSFINVEHQWLSW